MNKKILIDNIIAVVILIIVSFSSVAGFQPKKAISTVCPNISNDPPPKNIYLEDVKILLSGRCRDVGWAGDWNWKWLHIGYFRYFDTVIGTTWLERANIIVYNKSIFDPFISFSGLTRTYVLTCNATGIFYYSAWMGRVSKIPWRIFFHCHADRLWIRDKDAVWEP